MGVFRKISHEGCAAHCYFQKGRLIEESSMKSEKKFRAQKTTVKQLWVVSLLSFMTAKSSYFRRRKQIIRQRTFKTGPSGWLSLRLSYASRQYYWFKLSWWNKAHSADYQSEWPTSVWHSVWVSCLQIYLTTERWTDLTVWGSMTWDLVYSFLLKMQKTTTMYF